MELETFSCFDNFVPSNNCGVPEYTPTHNALHHLERLLGSVSDRIGIKKSTEESALEDGEILGVRFLSLPARSFDFTGSLRVSFSESGMVESRSRSQQKRDRADRFQQRVRGAQSVHLRVSLFKNFDSGRRDTEQIRLENHGHVLAGRGSRRRQKHLDHFQMPFGNSGQIG